MLKKAAIPLISAASITLVNILLRDAPLDPFIKILIASTFGFAAGVGTCEAIERVLPAQTTFQMPIEIEEDTINALV